MVSQIQGARGRRQGAKSAGNSASWGDGIRCQDWYTFEELEGRIPDCRSYDAETARAKWSADKWDGKQIGIWCPKKMTGMMCMQHLV